MSIPIEGGQLENWTPPSLANIAEPPSFSFRPWGVRDRQRYNDILIEEGLRHYPTDQIRDVVVEGVQANWSKDEADKVVADLRTSWEQQDAGMDAIRDMEPDESIEDDKERSKEFLKRQSETYNAIVDMELLDKAVRWQDEVAVDWPDLAKMIARNQRFNRESPLLILAACLTGWKNIEAKFCRENGRASYGAVIAAQDALKKIEQDNADNAEGIGVPGTAFGELLSKATSHIFLSKEEAKNSASPPSSSSTPSPSKGSGRGKTDGESPAKTASSKNSRKTRPTS